ncbi:MAG: hypothetical protein HN531_15685 [Opitutae bacterium]|nr:hypothetical protein [Opitutae bacterium]
MTDAQKFATRETLNGYDPNDLNHNDINEIHAAFHRAKIKPSEEHRDLVHSMGFDTHQLRPGLDDTFAPAQRKVDGSDKKSVLVEMLEKLESGKLLDFLQFEEPELMELLERFEPDELVELLESRDIDHKMTDKRKALAQRILEDFDAPEDAVGSSGKQTLLREMLETFEVLKMLGSGKWDKSMLGELRTALAASGNGNAGNMIDRQA